ncbi:MAG: hypothetical protein HYT75_07670, partial [Deltaproteobacteria bacterium]|nr:hypothetical protein [Deltaproteobacteria bacterium]
MDVSNIKSGAEIKKGEISIIRKLGEGYGGVVYLAHDEIRNQNVAIKFLKKTEKNHELWIKRFKREYKKQLIGKEFSNIAEIYQFGRFHGSLYFTSEYVSDAN